jgi:hypothetical protein
MKPIFIAALFAATASSAGYANPYTSDYGIVESVREVQLIDEPPGFPGVSEHAFKPRTGDELLVTLDDGRAITVVQAGMRIFQPGQRVLVVPGRKGARVEPAGDRLPL